MLGVFVDHINKLQGPYAYSPSLTYGSSPSSHVLTTHLTPTVDSDSPLPLMITAFLARSPTRISLNFGHTHTRACSWMFAFLASSVARPSVYGSNHMRFPPQITSRFGKREYSLCHSVSCQKLLIGIHPVLMIDMRAIQAYRDFEVMLGANLYFLDLRSDR